MKKTCHFSEEEIKILGALVIGFNHIEIMSQLQIPFDAMQKHMDNILENLGVKVEHVRVN